MRTSKGAVEMTGTKMRVYEIAREVGLPNKELIAKIRQLGLEVNNHMSSLEADDVNRVKQHLERDRLANTETKRLSSTVLRRRSKGKKAAPKVEAAPVAEPPPPVKVAEPAKAPVRRRAVAKPVEAKPAPVVEAKPAPVVEAKPEPVVEAPAKKPAKKAAPVVVEAKPEPVVEAKPEPVVEAKPEPVVEAKPEPVAAKAPAAEKKPPKARVVVDGPPVVDVPGRKRKAKSAPVVETRKGTTKAPAKPEPAPEGPPETIEDVAATAAKRFEQELARARNRVAERESQKADQPEEPKVEEDPNRDPSRPAVGSIIRLPVPRIKITERAPTRQVPGQGQIRGRFAQQRGRGPRGRGGRNFKKQQQFKKGGGKATQITTPAEHKRVIRMQDTIAIPELAKHMGVKANEVLKKLWSMGMLGININATIDHETAQIITGEFGYEVQNVAFKEDDVFAQKEDAAEDLLVRAPVVTVMGHVDHGKTSLLDAIRKANVTKGEHGGITQHIAAYRVSPGKDLSDIVFLDTPGHAAFTEMRARGAQATDIVVLVVAADDGVMPQTKEAISHSKDAGVPIIVAINKCDLPDANPERSRQQLAEHGLIPEEWGGDTIYIEVSALKGDGVGTLLESIALSAEIMELRANPKKSAVGIVVEAKLDRNRGSMATILVKDGTLRTGDIAVAGEYYGKVRAMLDDKGRHVKEAGPSTPVAVLGLDGVPLAGEVMNVADDDKMAKQVVEHRREAKRKKELATTGKISLENILEQISEGGAKELKIVLKADVQGSAEALKEALIKLSTEKVKVNVIQAGVGGITESDVNLAKAGGAIIVGFHVRTAGKSSKLAEKEGVQINLYNVIYEALDEVKLAMAGLLAPVQREQTQGKLEVRDTFTIPKKGTVAGCMVTEGKIQRKSLLRVVRNAVQVFEGRVDSLKRFKDDASEVASGFECGVMIAGFNDLEIGDIIETYEIIEEAATL